MHWLIDAFWARIGWAIGELAIFLFVLAVFGALLLFMIVPRLIRQRRCRHQHYRETGSCDAICNDCGKNLGFIGSIRDAAPRL